jgi:hypothetical protein
LIPKGAIAYAGTFAVGKGLEFYQRVNRFHTAEERAGTYKEALEEGRDVAASLREKMPAAEERL